MTKEVISLLISIVAVVVAVTSIYFSNLKPAKLEIYIGEEYQIWHDINKSLVIDIPIHILNKGSKPATIRNLGLILKSSTNDAIYLTRRGYVEYVKNKNEKGNVSWQWEFKSMMSPDVIPSYGLSTNMVEFMGDGESLKNWIPDKLKYEINVIAWVAGSEKKIISEGKMNINESILNKIKANLEAGSYKGNWIVNPEIGWISKRLSKTDYQALISE